MTKGGKQLYDEDDYYDYDDDGDDESAPYGGSTAQVHISGGMLCLLTKQTWNISTIDIRLRDNNGELCHMTLNKATMLRSPHHGSIIGVTVSLGCEN